MEDHAAIGCRLRHGRVETNFRHGPLPPEPVVAMAEKIVDNQPRVSRFGLRVCLTVLRPRPYDSASVVNAKPSVAIVLHLYECPTRAIQSASHRSMGSGQPDEIRTSEHLILAVDCNSVVDRCSGQTVLPWWRVVVAVGTGVSNNVSAICPQVDMKLIGLGRAMFLAVGPREGPAPLSVNRLISAIGQADIRPRLGRLA